MPISIILLYISVEPISESEVEKESESDSVHTPLRLIHWVPLTTSEKMQKWVLTELFSIAVNDSSVRKSAC